MLSNSCLNCRKNTESKNPKVAKKPPRKTQKNNGFIKMCNV